MILELLKGTFSCPVLPGSTPPPLCYWGGSQFPYIVFVVTGEVARIVAFEVSVVFVVVVTVDAVTIVDADDAITVILLLLAVFCGQDLEKCPSCLQCQHCGFLPSTTTIITLSS